MVKKAALSVRIHESTKAAVEKAAAMDRRSVASLVDLILADATQAQRTGRPKKYSDLDEQLGAGGNLMDLLLPTGKTVAESTGEEIKAVAEAYIAAGKRLQTRAKKLNRRAHTTR